MQEVLEDFAVLGLLLLGLLLGLGFGAGAARPLLSAAHLGLGILRHLFDVDGAVGILPDGDFVCSGNRSPTRADMKVRWAGEEKGAAVSTFNRECGRFPTEGSNCQEAVCSVGAWTGSDGGSWAPGPPYLWSSNCAGTGSCPEAAAATSRCSN